RQKTAMNYEEIGESLRTSYAKVAERYRCDDEIEVTTEHHRHLKSILSAISSSFNRPISVLDAGCGTGRYFYCLKNVERLVGIDVSQEMLKIAEKPVRQEELSAVAVELKCGNIYLEHFPPNSFDMIYSLGMFGNGCPVTIDLCNKFHDWLIPGGKLFFDIVDVATLPILRRVRRRIRTGIYPHLPQRCRRILDRREGPLPFFGMNKKELDRIMRATRFTSFSVSSEVCHSPLWRGVHLECSASKAQVMKDGQ
ncbi:MAG TPA: class I SAM-dependent methyltransferase, partial [Verrucomicrobiae bacterium]|nr:class I SAM-dependent methyltransferase [Verrucomicrobiae bacterium]